MTWKALLMPNLVCLSGSYRSKGITEQMLDIICTEASSAGWKCERVRLADRKIEYCKNCRTCTQTPGKEWGNCVIQDDVKEIVSAVKKSDALVLACPVNFYDITAVMRAFEERLVGCCYWDWGRRMPVIRDKRSMRPSLLITSSAMPGLMARFITRSMKSLKLLSGCLQSRPVEKLYVGQVARYSDEHITEALNRRLRRATEKLLGQA